MASLRYRTAGLTTVFLIAFAVFLVALMPAAVITPLLSPPSDDDSSLPAPKLYGLWWNGQGQANWEGQSLDVTWRLDWRGLTPGLQLAVESGQISAQGWAGADWGDWRLEQWQASIPVAVLNDFFPQGQADGQLDIALPLLSLAGTEIQDIQGTLNYSGGAVTLGPGMSRAVPAIQGDLAMQEGIPVLAVTGPDQQSLAQANLTGQTLTLEVFRALPALLEMSEGGDASDVVFSTRQDVPVSSRSG